MFTSAANMALGRTTFDPTKIDAVQALPIGTTHKGVDPTLGEGEFIYLPGVANVVAGDLIAYDLLPSGPSIARATTGAHANSGQSVAVAIAAVTAGLFGWFQIGGCGIVNATAASAAGKAMLTATAGSVNSAAVAGSQVEGARLSSAVGTPAAGQAYITLSRPSVQTQIT